MGRSDELSSGKYSLWSAQRQISLHVDRMRVTCLSMLVILLNSCASRPTDLPTAADCEAPRAFYVVSHGWHTGLVLKRKDLIALVPPLANDFPTGDYLEIGWGDEHFYQAETVNLGLALRAILWPTTTVLHIVSVPDEPRRYFPGSEVIQVSVPQAGYQKLLAFLADSFARTSANEIIKLGPGLYGESRFYRAEGVFHAFNTCNTWVAKAIESTGFPISSATTITAAGVLSQLRRAAGASRQCYSVS